MKTNPINPQIPSNGPRKPDTRAVAREFEALFCQMMLRGMRKTVPEGGLLEKSLGEKIYTDMLDEQYSGKIARHASLGLADLILKEIDSDEFGGMQSLRNLKMSSWMIDNRFVPKMASSDVRSIEERLSPYEKFITEAASRYNIDTTLIRSVIAQESAGNPWAVSHAGAKGLMQLIDSTARHMGVGSVFDPRSNIMGGTKYLRELLDRFDGNERLALASYNAGPSAVEKYGGIPPYRETQDYVERVLGFREQFSQQAQPNGKESGNGQENH
ncbi:MAG: transglycosylase SLT domain-containing protein [Chitinivibrionales bacterium]|nr:transglycosylase SLT domain-containing protein [Chitinivibrionales bacterium]